MQKQRFLLAVAAIAVAVVATGCAQTKTSTAGSKEKGLKSVYFDFDASDIRSDAEALLKGNANWLKQNSKAKVTIEGNCDERGTPEYNLALGDRRARSTKSYLVNLGVDKDRLTTVSYGEEKPVADCHDKSCWSKNRRSDFKTK